MSDDLIRRSDAIAEIYKVRTPDVASHHYAELFINAVRRAPSADRPQGEWVYPTDIIGFGRCNNCKALWDKSLIDNIYFKYCPRCGARMKGADDE